MCQYCYNQKNITAVLDFKTNFMDTLRELRLTVQWKRLQITTVLKIFQKLLYFGKDFHGNANNIVLTGHRHTHNTHTHTHARTLRKAT